MLQAVTESSLPISEFGDIVKHKLVTLDDSNETILKYLRSGVLKECRFCPENFESIEAKQIPIEKLKHIQKIITEKNKQFNESHSSKLILPDQMCNCDNQNDLDTITRNAG